VAVLVEVQVELGVIAVIVDAFDVGTEAVDAEVDFEVQLPGGDLCDDISRFLDVVLAKG
jgi:hypothetical protein